MVDADACPVKEIIISVAREWDISVELIASINHHIISSGDIKVIKVDNSPQAADLAIANRVNADDIVITDDYGLAALVLGKKGNVISSRGYIYTDKNIDELLMTRHIAAKFRRSGGKTKGPSSFNEEHKTRFKNTLIKLIQKSYD